MEGEDGSNISDFTAVTPMEQLANRIEMIINEWGLGGRIPILDYTKAMVKTGMTLQSQEIKIEIGEEEVLFNYFSPKCDLPQLRHNLASPLAPNQLLCDLENTNLDLFVGHHITAMYGPMKFCTLRLPPPRQIATEDDILYLKNAYCSAAEASQCYLPCFILNSDPSKQLYSGIAMGEDSYTVFESALLRRGQKQHLHLSGLVSLFKNKVDTPTFRSQGDVRVSVMFEYEREKLPENGLFQMDEGLVPTLDTMCCGTLDSPIQRISLLASWPNQSEDVLNEGHNYCDLEETNAFDWQFLINFEPTEGCMAITLRNLLDTDSEGDDRKIEAHLKTDRKLKEAMRSFSSPSASITNPTGVDYDPENILPMSVEKQDIWLNAVWNYGRNKEVELPPLLKQLYHRTKSFEPGTALDRLAVAFYSLSLDFPWKLHWKWSEHQLFVAFANKLREEYPKMQTNENNQVPSYLKSRLHQLLEMLQLCANNRNMFFGLMDTATEGNDEFYDATENVDQRIDAALEKNHKEAESKEEENEALPRGRKEHYQNLYLINWPDVPLYEFHTQQPKPNTEKEIKEIEEKLTEELDEHEQFVQFMAPLRSDMQAFKAANPLGQFADFIRWHSPKDFNEETKELSSRFELPGNDWIKLWDSVSAVPVISQEKLFNDAAVMEEVLDELENVTVLDITSFMLPLVYTRAGAELIKNFYDLGDRVLAVDSIKEKMEKLVETLGKATNGGDRDDYLEALKNIVYLEKAYMIYKAAEAEITHWIQKSILDGPLPNKDEVDELICYLLEQWDRNFYKKEEPNLFPRGFNIAGAATSPFGRVLHKLMCNGEVDASNYERFPKPSNRFYTVHWVTVCPSDGSRPVPHRMTAALKDDEFRVCGSFTADYKKS